MNRALLCWAFGHKFPVTTLFFVKLRSRCVRCDARYLTTVFAR